MKIFLIISAVVASLIASAVPIPGTDVWYSQFVSVCLFGLLFIAVLISEMSVALGLLYAYLAISTVFITHQDTMALMCMLQVGACLLAAREIAKLTTANRKKIWIAITCLLILQILWGILQHFNLDPLFRLKSDNNVCDTVGFSGSHNQYGLFLAVASPVAFLFPILAPFVVVGIILSTTFTAAIGLVCAWGFLLRKKISVGIILLVALLICASSTVINNKNLVGKFDQRRFIWQLSVKQVLSGRADMQVAPKTFKVVNCNPWFGFGFQKFFSISPFTQMGAHGYTQVDYYEHAHNDYVEALFDLGIVGFFLLILVLWELGYLFYMTNGASNPIGLELAVAGLIAYASCAVSIYTVHTAYNGFFLCVLLGLFYGEVNDGKKRRK